jgi:methenyltetrahydromethanopterin cyclohydrolase
MPGLDTDENTSMTLQLNERALRLVDTLVTNSAVRRVSVHTLATGARVVDCGIKVEGGLGAGIALARVCLADLADVSLVPGTIGDVACPHIQVATDHPVAACMASQYAGWQISVDLPAGADGKAKKYFAMGSGPIRAAAGREEIFDKIGYRESTPVAVGVLETRKIPTDEVAHWICERTKVPPSGLSLLVAPTASQAGTVQVVARSVETALHKLYELGFDLGRVVSAHGAAPLPPVARDDLAAIGRTNDAVLYGGRVTLWVRGDDASIEAIGSRVPSAASSDYGVPFAEIFDRAGGDFYKIDPHLFSPAELTFCNLDSGSSRRFGSVNSEILRKSFGL